MYNEPNEPDFNFESIKQMRLLMRAAIGLILDEKSADEFLEWSQQSVPVLAPIMLESFEDEERHKMAYWIGVNLWNSAPQSTHYFKPTPLDKPSRNTNCPCGSGLKYKQCCAHLPMPPHLPENFFWLLMPEVMPKTHIIRLIKSHQLPLHAVAIMADFFTEQGDDAQVIKMLEPLFEGNASRLNHQHSGLLDVLCDSYNIHYKTEKKKKDLLQRMSQHKDKSIRAEAWQRTASWKLDAGDFSAAMDALSKAMQADPQNPSHSLLELTLLVSSNQLEQARQRAVFWHHKLKHLEYELPELLNTLKAAQSDPASALQLTLSNADDDPRLRELLAWIDANKDLPTVEYSLEKIEMATDEDEGELPCTDPMQNACILQPPEAIFELEMQWAAIKPNEKPFGTQLDTMGEGAIWEDIFNTEWLDFLLINPQAINSQNINDDLVNLIYSHPVNDSIWGPMAKVQPLLNRNERLIRDLNIPEGYHLPWIMPENRPLLRQLTHNINLALGKDERNHAIELMKLYLKLNPHDNHGYRSLLINHYLQHNENHEAITLADNYPDDMLAETSYGLVLALYRSGELQKAEQALHNAFERLPKVADYLIKARIAQPQLSDFGIQFNGDDQAWFYRDEMRETWKKTEGCLTWLKKQLKSQLKTQ